MFSFFNTKDYELEKIIMINSVIPKLEKKNCKIDLANARNF